MIGLYARPRWCRWRQALDQFSVARTANHDAGVPMSRTHDAQATGLQVEFIGLVQPRQGVPANAEIKFASLEFIGVINDHSPKAGAIEQGSYYRFLIVPRYADGDLISHQLRSFGMALADQLRRSCAQARNKVHDQLRRIRIAY